MDEARSLTYSINVKAILDKAQDDIRNFVGSLGNQATGSIEIRADTASASGSIRDLTQEIGNIDAGEISIVADTSQAEENVREIVGDLGGLQSSEIVVDADTSQAHENIGGLSEEIGNLQNGEISVDADTSQAESSLHELAVDIGSIVDDVGDVKIEVDTSEAEQNVEDLSDDVESLEDKASSLGSAFRKSFLSSIDSGNSLASSIKSGLGGAFDYTKDKASNVFDSVKSKAAELRDDVVQTATKIGNGFAHPVETIKSGLGGAIDHAKSRFVDFVRGAEEAADAADDVGDSSKGAEPAVKGLGDAAGESGGKFETLGDILTGFGKAAVATVTAATVAVGGLAASSVSTGMAFDSSMSQVAATMGYSVADINTAGSEANQTFTQLREFAMEMGESTAFSAKQSADALNYMALAGYDAETSMSMLPNVLNLAAAGGIELASASDMITDAQSALGLSIDETSELVDKMARASSQSNTSVAQLGSAILTVGGTAKNLAGGTTELSTALGILADNGTKGAEGGTALRNIILSLGAPTDKAAAALKSLGVEVYDAEGNMRPLNETFGDLNAAMADMTQSERTNLLSELFNKADLKSVNALLDTSAERWEELGSAIDGAWVNMGSLSDSLTDVGLDLSTMESNLGKLGISQDTFSSILSSSGGDAEAFADALLEAADAGVTQEDVISALGGDLGNLQTAFDNTTGAAQAMADTQLDNLAGDITLFQSALEGAKIAISDELTPTLREFTQFGTNAISTLSGAFQEGGFTGAMGALGGIISDGLGMVAEMLPTVVDAGMQLLGALGQGLLDNAPALIDTAIQIVTILGDGILGSLPVLAGAAVEIVASLASGVSGMLPELIPTIVETVTLIAGALIENAPLLIDAGMQLISGLAEGVIGAIPVLIEQLPVLIDQIVGFLSESMPTLLEQGSTILTSIGEGLMGAIPLLVEMLPQIITSICGFVTENLPTVAEQGIQILTSLATGLIGALPELIAQVPAIITGIVGTLAENFPSIVSSGVLILQELGNGIISTIPELVAQLPAIGTAILGALAQIPGLVLDVGKNIVEGLWNGISSMASWIGEKVKEFAGGIVDGIKGFLGIHSPSTVFAEIGDNMALGIGKGFADTMASVTKDIEGALPTDLEVPEPDVPDPDVPDPDVPDPDVPDPDVPDPDVPDPDVPDPDGPTVSWSGYSPPYDLPGPADYNITPVMGIPDMPEVSDVTFGIHPVVDVVDAPEVSDVSFGIHPVVDSIGPMSVDDVLYGVHPAVEDFEPPDLTSSSAVSGVVGETDRGGGTSDAPAPRGSAPVPAFSPTITINVNGDVDDDKIAQLREEMMNAVRELYEEFRNEELEHTALKEQYAF